MDTLFSRVSDEALFLQMTLGDKFSQDILLRRYEHLGRQIAMVFARQNCLKNVTDQDFIEVIYDTIFRTFRYYNLHGQKYFVFCRESLNQELYREASEKADNQIKQKSIVNLDDKFGDNDELLFSDVIEDKPVLDFSEQCDIDLFLENLSSTNSLKKRKIARIYLMHVYGYTLTEIAKKTNSSIYEVRNVVNNAEEIIRDLDITVDYRFR